MAKAKLTDIEKGIIILRLGADGRDCRSLREIAKMAGMSVGRVAFIERRAIRKLGERYGRGFTEAWELYKIHRYACQKRIARGILQ